jgi:hypothetical protein
VSYPLTDYTDDPAFQVVKQFSAQFTWGEAEIYLHEKVEVFKEKEAAPPLKKEELASLKG